MFAAASRPPLFCTARVRVKRKMDVVKSTVEDGIRILREATKQAAQVRIELTDDYRELIAQVEALTENRAGADKSWVARLLDWSTEHYTKAIRRS